MENRVVQWVLSILFPFYPLWGALFYFILNRNISHYINLLLFPFFLFVLLTNKNFKIPKYLLFILIFTLYHLCSVYIFDTITRDSSWFILIKEDINIASCFILFIIENTKFEKRFILKMNRNILLIVILSLVVSIVQIKYPSFFVSAEIMNSSDKTRDLEGRIFSIYSWININSLGITFPILISILLNVYPVKRKTSFFIFFSGIIVSFLTRARYIMLSTIIVLSQLFINSKITIQNKIKMILIIILGTLFTLKGAELFDYNIQQVIDERILEKDSDLKSAKARVDSYYVFLQKFPEHPWFGVGPRTRDDVLQLLNGVEIIHVGYLSYLYFYGIFGFTPLILSLFFLLKKAFFTGQKYFFWGSFYGLVGFCVANFTFVYFNLSEMGIIIAVIYLKFYNQKIQLTYYPIKYKKRIIFN